MPHTTFAATGAFGSASQQNLTGMDMSASPGSGDLSGGGAGGDDDDRNSAAAGQQVIEAQRIERPLRVTPRDEKNDTLGVPFAPPDPNGDDDEDDEDAVQVIELDHARDDRSSQGQSGSTSRRGSLNHTARSHRGGGPGSPKNGGGGGRYDPVAELTMRDYIYFLFDGFPSKLYRKRTLGWVHASEVFNNFMLLVVLISCFSFAAETLPEYYDRNLLSFTIIEACCIAVFTVDFIARIALVRDKLRFLRSVQNWIDFVSIVPFYVTLFIGTGNQSAGGFVMLRMLRLMRVFRILKLSKRNVGLQAVVEAMLQSSEAISLLTFLLMIATVLFSSAMFFAEQTGSHFDEERLLWIRDNGRVSPYQSIFHTMWWCIVTMTTVGYGDDVPVTPLGKVIGSITMLCGVFVLAFPTVILSTNFQEVHQAKVDQHKQMREELEEIEHEADGDGAEGNRTSDDDDDDGLFASASVASPTALEGGNTLVIGASMLKVDPRFEALVEKLQSNYSKFTRFTYSFNPYVLREGKIPKTTSKMKRRGSAMMFAGGQVSTMSSPQMFAGSANFARRQSSASAGGASEGTPRQPSVQGAPIAIDVSKPDFEQGSSINRQPTEASVNVPPTTNDSFAAASTHVTAAASVEKIVTGLIQIVDNEVAVFTPALYFAATDTNHLYVRVEAVPGSEQQLVTLHLVVDAEACREVVAESIRKHRPDETFIPVARPMRKVQLKLEATHALLRDVKLVTTLLDSPVGTVPISLLVPNASVLAILLNNLSGLTFNVRAYYDEAAAVVEPLVRYGGVLLTGDAFDNDDDLQLFIAEEDERQQQDLHGATSMAQTMGAAGGGAGTSRARRGSNFIAASAHGPAPTAAAAAGAGRKKSTGTLLSDDDAEPAIEHTAMWPPPNTATSTGHGTPARRRRSSALEPSTARRGGDEARPPPSSALSFSGEQEQRSESPPAERQTTRTAAASPTDEAGAGAGLLDLGDDATQAMSRSAGDAAPVEQEATGAAQVPLDQY